MDGSEHDSFSVILKLPVTVITVDKPSHDQIISCHMTFHLISLWLRMVYTTTVSAVFNIYFIDTLLLCYLVHFMWWL